MRSFKDRNGKAWSIDLTIGSLKRVKAETGVDLLDLAHHERCQPLVDRLTDDPFIVCEIIFAACAPNVTREEFADGLDGPTMEAATEALLKAIADFSPSQRRPLLAKVVDKLGELDAKRTAAAMKLLDDPRMDQALEAALNFGPLSTGSPGSSALSPTT